MKNLNIKKVKKFWSILSSLGKASVQRYQERCERDIFVSRVSRLILCPKQPLKILFDESTTFEYIIPSLDMTYKRDDGSKYNKYALSYCLQEYGEEIYFSYIDYLGKTINKKLTYNSCIRLMHQQTSLEKFDEIYNIFSLSLKEVFQRKYFIIKRQVGGSEHKEIIDDISVRSKKDLNTIKTYLEKKFNFIEYENHWNVDLHSMNMKELTAARSAPRGEIFYVEGVYNLVMELL